MRVPAVLSLVFGFWSWVAIVMWRLPSLVVARSNVGNFVRRRLAVHGGDSMTALLSTISSGRFCDRVTVDTRSSIRRICGFCVPRSLHQVTRATAARRHSPSSSLSSTGDSDERKRKDTTAASPPPLSDFFANPDEHPTFASIGVVSTTLLRRLDNLGLDRPSAVQAAAYSSISSDGDATVGAETGSGKTLAYLLPLIDDILERKKEADGGFLGYDYARAIILVPNKELANQVIRMAADLCGGPHSILQPGGWDTPVGGEEVVSAEGGNHDSMEETDLVRVAMMPGGLSTPRDFFAFRHSKGLGGSDDPVDLVVTTPASLGPLALSPKNIDLFADVQTLVVDEADMLLDGGYIRQLENVLMGFRRADKLHSVERKTQHVFVAATLPDMGLKSVDAYLQRKFPQAERVTMAGMHNARHYGLQQRTMWLKDDPGAGNKERIKKLVKMLNTPREDAGLADEKVMIFLNSVDDVDGATNALRRAGVHAVPYHAKITLGERVQNLDKFRRYEARASPDEIGDTVSVLVCTDLASRGLDIPGVTAVVQLQFAGNVVAHLHRMGRCGRAGKRDGRGVIFYGPQEELLVSVVRDAEIQQDRMVLKQDVDEENLEKGSSSHGSVKKAFSRRRGFTKKVKKARKEARESGGD